jgi:hypothetical protein
MTLALSLEYALVQSQKLSPHCTRKDWSLRVSDLSKVSGSWTLVQVEDFFRAERLLASKVMALVRSAGGCSGGSGVGSSRSSVGGTELSMSLGSSRRAPVLVLGGIAIRECEFK